MKQRWDAIVVGTGPSGAMVANELVKQKKKVLILEKGYLDYTINIPRMLKNKEMMFIGNGKTMVRGIRTGGSSILYYGTAYLPPIEFFLKYGVDLTNEVEQIKSSLPITPLRDELIGQGASKIMDAANQLGYSWNKLDKFIYQERCTLTDFPYEAQWNATELIKEAVALGAELQNGAEVTSIILDQNKATGVKYSRRGEQIEAYASQIVLAAGGIATAQILQMSGLRAAGNGFFCDPLVIVQGTIKGFECGNEIPMTTGVNFEQDGFILTDITLPKLVYQLFAAQVFRLDRLFDHSQTIGIMVKIRDSISGRITKEGKTQKSFTTEDKQKMNKGIRLARRILDHAGAKGVFQTAWTAAHPGGTVRMGELVDSNLETEYKQLYVCDCSVIPTEWGLPPTWTLLALAKRLGKHLNR